MKEKEATYITDPIANFIKETVDASDVDYRIKNGVAYAIGLYKGGTHLADPLRSAWEILQTNYQSLETGLPIAMEAMRNGGLTPNQARSIKLPVTLLDMVNGKIKQVQTIIEDNGTKSYEEAGKLTMEVFAIIIFAKLGTEKSVGENPNPKVVKSEPPPAEMAVDIEISPTTSAKGLPKPSPKFETPTNEPHPPLEVVPEEYNQRIMKPTQQYPNGYWVLEKLQKNGGWQKVDPSTMKPGKQSETHVPLPEGYWSK